MKVLLIILGVIFLIGCIPVSVLFRYHDQIELKLSILFIKIGILPQKPQSRKKREKAAAKKTAKAEAKKSAKAEQAKQAKAKSLVAKPKSAEPPKPQPKKSLGDKLEALLPWARLGAGFVGEFFHRKLTVTRLRIRVALAGGDPARTGQAVGRAWEIIGATLPILERAFRIRERKLAVYPDFTAAKTDLEAELRVRVRVGGVVLLGLKYGFRALRLYLARRKAAKRPDPAEAAPEPNQQGEATTEPNEQGKVD